MAALTMPLAGADRTPVILISVDTLRADRLGCYGYRGVATPHFDAIAQGGTRFSHVSAQVPLTLPSHVGLLTSTYPFSNGVRDNGQTLGPGAVSLATVLKANGYRTGAFLASFVLDRRFGLARGFDEYNGNFDVRQANSTDPGDIRRSGEEVVRSAMDWLRQDSRRPFFLFLHLYDLHTPYSIPGRTGRLTYDDMLAYEDSVVGRFWEFLSQQGILDRALIVFTSDHGEGLNDHGETAHGYFIYQSTLWVPLVFRWPHGSSFPAVIDDAVGLIDVAPAIVDHLGIPRPSEFQGRSLMNVLRGRHEPQEVYSESSYAQKHFGCSSLTSVSDGTYKYIASSKPEIYDLTRDPGERNNLYNMNAALAARYRERIGAITARNARKNSRQPGDAETIARLRSLGYLAGTSASSGAEESRPAPRERIELWEQYSRALAFASAGQRSRAAGIMRQMLERAPDLTDVRLSLGLLRQQQGRHADAAAEFRRLLDAEPKNAVAHFDLGVSLQMLGNSNAARDEFEAALALEPNYIRAEEMIAGQLLESRRFNEAEAHYHHILTLDPANFGAQYNLGVLAASRQQWDDARRRLEAALRVNPNSGEAHNVLGGVWFRQGQLPAARREFTEAVRLSPKLSMAHYNLGLVLRKDGDTDGAAKEFRRALDCDPNNQAARAALIP